MTQTTIHPRERTAQLAWTGFILIFFVIQAIIWTVAITITSRDSSHAVIEGYDEQALKWDDVQSRRRASEALGWSCEIVVGDVVDVFENRAITISLADKNQQPVEQASVNLQAFHRGRAAEKQRLQFQNVGGGIYASTLQVRHPGIWQFSGSAVCGDQIFLIEQRQAMSETGSH